MVDIKNPLSEEQFEKLQGAAQKLDDAEELLGKSERAGVEMPGLRENIKSLRSQVNRLKQQFFPGR